ncbi:MAG: flagellar basal body P-ring formation chaperone FlgA [Rickettsiales bacterium]|nr:flagellar basal body P-ring formation chaperone FlgA [Rickettsiales bacterium]
MTKIKTTTFPKRWHLAAYGFVFTTLCLFANMAFASSMYHVSLDDIEKQVAQELEYEGAGNNIEVHVIERFQRRMHQGEEPVHFTIEKLEYNPRAMRWTALLTVFQDDQSIASHDIGGRYESKIAIPVLKQRLHSSDVIDKDDITWIDYPEHRLRKDVVLSEKSLIGMSPKRVISENRQIRHEELQEPIVMKKGSLVNVIFISGGMEIRTQGEAMDDAALGQLIRVRNTDSNMVIQAMAVAPSVAQVNPTIPLPESLASLR